MKKLMFAAAVVTAGFAMADVTSANVVGYNTVTLQPGFNLVAVNFKNVADTEGIAMQDLFPGGGKDVGYVAGSSLPKADTIQFYVDGDYISYFLYKPAKGTKNAYWWVDVAGQITNRKIKNGDAFWYLNRATTNVVVTTSGEVELSAKKEIPIQYGFNMIGSYFPAGWTVNDTTYYTPAYWEASGAVAGSSIPKADCIQTYVDGNYVTYFLYAPAKGTKNKFTWVDVSGTPVVGNILTAGQGAWYLHRGTGMTLEIMRQF